jgi:ABC-type taurine transport system ATPase subunit
MRHARLAALPRAVAGELSLGQARRVAWARGRGGTRPSSCSTSVRVARRSLAARLREELTELVNSRPVTTLLMHDVEEAIGLADRLFLLSASPPVCLPTYRSSSRAQNARRRNWRRCGERSRASSAINPGSPDAALSAFHARHRRGAMA